MSARFSENTEKLSWRARQLLNQELRDKLNVRNELESIENTPLKELACANRVSEARRQIRAEWAQLKGNSSGGSPLAGIVVLVCVKNESKAFALRSVLAALGATVTTQWSITVTHVVWQPGGEKNARVQARSTNAHVVSPRWVEACAEKNARVPERLYGTPSRPSDPPEPAQLRRILRIAEKENMALEGISEEDTSSDSAIKLRVSSDSSRDRSRDYVNTETRRVCPAVTGNVPMKSRRKLFTRLQTSQSSNDTASDTEAVKSSNPYKNPTSTRTKKGRQRNEKTAKLKENLMTPRERKIQTACVQKLVSTITQTQRQAPHGGIVVVLSGMGGQTRRELIILASGLTWTVNRKVTSHTTHVLVEDCRRTLAALLGAARGCWVLHSDYLRQCAAQRTVLPPDSYQLDELRKTSTRARVERAALQWKRYVLLVFAGLRAYVSPTADNALAVTELLQLCGATLLVDKKEADIIIMGPNDEIVSETACVVSKWVTDSVAAGRRRTTKKYRLNNL